MDRIEEWSEDDIRVEEINELAEGEADARQMADDWSRFMLNRAEICTSEATYHDTLALCKCLIAFEPVAGARMEDLQDVV